MKIIENIYIKFGWCCKNHTKRGSKINILEVMKNNDIDYFLSENNISYKYYNNRSEIGDLGFHTWGGLKGYVFKKDDSLFLIEDNYWDNACIKCFRCHSEINELLSRFEEMKDYFNNINVVNKICKGV